MKTLQELYKEIINSDELKKAFTEAAKAGEALEFIKAHGCETTEEELKAFLSKQSGELSDDELDNAAGGTCNSSTFGEMAASISGWGVGCVIAVVASAALGHVGQETPEEGRLCTTDKDF